MYTFSKAKHLFFHTLRAYRRKKHRLAQELRKEITQALDALQRALLDRDRARVDVHAKKVHALAKTALKKSPLAVIFHWIFSLCFALAAAIVIRSVWFEFFEIPTGSMRPTFAEKDHLSVSKTAFGINVPLRTAHLYFDPNLIKRGDIVVFTTANMQIPDADTRYFYLFPGKKQYVKRVLGKPKDTLYFYGGQIYGIDGEGRDITKQLQPPLLRHIDHVPYICFDGKRKLLTAPRSRAVPSSVRIYQMHQPVASIEWKTGGRLEGKLLPPYDKTMTDYDQLWGFGNYGMSRILTKAELFSLTDTQPDELADAPLYLQIFHHPSVKTPTLFQDAHQALQLGVSTHSALLPLQEKQMRTLFSSLYTARFIVKDGLLHRYDGMKKPQTPCSYCPKIFGVPDGTYEFYYGKGYEILWGGIRKTLPKEHPLLVFTPARLQLFYNLGFQFHRAFAPLKRHQHLLPQRFVYYRNGDLYAMGAPLLKKTNPMLAAFIENERIKKDSSPARHPYVPFTDSGAPLTSTGAIDREKIKRYGIKVPEDHYLVLGDNYAMSADSRDFGFVPKENLRGTPFFIFLASRPPLWNALAATL